MKKHLLKKAALVAITITSVAATSGVADAATASSTPVAVKTAQSGESPAPMMMSRAGIRW